MGAEKEVEHPQQPLQPLSPLLPKLGQVCVFMCV
jgi:hypothetical protein